MFNNTANGVIFKKKVLPKKNKYQFTVTELYCMESQKDVHTSYVVELPTEAVDFKKEKNGFSLFVDEKYLQNLNEKAKEVGCEIYIYPKFEE